MKRSIIIASTAVLVAGAAGGVAVASGTLDDDQPITGEALQQATDAALEHLGEGEVTETEVDDEDSKYEVEVTLDDGSEVDVQLDEEFNVVGTEAEDADEDDQDDNTDE